MGQKVYRQGLIKKTSVDDTDVLVNLDLDDDFSVTMFELYLQVNYPDAVIVERISEPPASYASGYDMIMDRVLVRFTTKEEALHFHLSH
jgi:hypothetical protein